MNISRENIDELNAVVKVDIAKEDYDNKVEKILKDYRKTANIPGFRKGHVPFGMIKKQYGQAVLVDEVNKLLQEALNKYLTEEKLDVLGNPLPKEQKDFNWDKDEYSFEFELGLAPKFDIELNTEKPVTQYTIVADDKMVENQIKTLRKQYGKLIPQDEATAETLVTGTFSNEEEEIENSATFSAEELKGKKNKETLVGKKVGETISFNTKGLVEDDHSLISWLKIDHDKAHGLAITVDFKITEINKQEMAELNQDFFDKVYGKDEVKSEDELRAKIKEEAEKHFAQQSDQQLLNDVTEALIEKTEFDLPKEFLQKWIQTTGENPMTDDEAKEEYEKSEKGLRYQLIEGKIVEENKLEIKFEDVKGLTSERIKAQMAQFGQMNPSDKEVDEIAARVLSNQDEAKKISEQVMSQKLLDLFKEKANLETKEVTYEEFIKEVYQ